jgi:hypothetical protein
MPTLEDTSVDFPVTTLSDLLEAEAKAGIASGADEDKYRRWAFLSTGAAGLLAIILAVVLITGGGDDGGGSQSKAQTAQKPAGWSEVPLTGLQDGKIPDPKAGNYYKVTSKADGSVIAAAAMLTSYKSGLKSGQYQAFNILLAVPPAEEKGLITAEAKSLNFSPVAAPAPGQSTETTATTAPPPPQAPSAPTPEAPATTPTS